MTPRLPHQDAPEVVEVVLGESAAFEHGGSLDDRTATDHDAKWFAAGMRVDDHHPLPTRRGLPSLSSVQIQGGKDRRDAMSSPSE
jgi:hypothetical protein